jgi:polyisoprenyl-phosphate glycosyltransferase
MNTFHTISILIPVYNDWESCGRLLREIDTALKDTGRQAQLLVVDDGSTEGEGLPDLPDAPQAIPSVTVLRLATNLGHQRAIAVGLSWLAEQEEQRPVCIIDGDGEDNPLHIDDLLAELEAHPECAAVFAKRGKRTESLLVRMLYICYKLFHRLLTGFVVDIGNFSVLHPRVLPALTSGSALWNHYPAAVIKSRLPIRKIRKNRGMRYAGQSKMTLPGLFIHGLSAASVFSDVLGVRMLIGVGFFVSTLLLALLLLVPAFPALSNDALTLLIALALVLLPQLGILALVFIIFVLSSRNTYSFIPRRDYAFFIKRIDTVRE